MFGEWDAKTRLHYYQRHVYENGAQAPTTGVRLDPKLVDREAQKEFVLTPGDRLLYRTRYFTDSGVIGTKAFVSRCSTLFEHHFTSHHVKRPRPIAGLPGVYALKWLANAQ